MILCADAKKSMIKIGDDKALTVNVEPYRAKTMTVPYWEGELLPVDARTAKKVGHFRTKIPDKMSDKLTRSDASC